MHTKRSRMPTTWPVERKKKGERFIARPKHFSNDAISVLVLIRDVLKLADSRKEVKMIMNKGDVLVNGVVRKDELFPVRTFDNISLVKLDKHYRLNIVGSKYSLEETSKEQSTERVLKILGKKILDKGKIQMNLEGGVNILYNKTFNVGDSALYSFKENKVSKVISLKKGCKIQIIRGKHAGEIGEMVDSHSLKKGKIYEIKFKEGTVLLPYNTLLVIE